MSFGWSWSFGINEPTRVYAAETWSVSGTTQVDTQSTTVLHRPEFAASPGNKQTCEIKDGGHLQTPQLPPLNSSNEGWYCWRQTHEGEWAEDEPMLDLYDDSTSRLTLRPSGDGATATIELVANGTLIGATSTSIMSGEAHWFSLRFDFTSNPVRAGLWIDGVEEIAMSNGGAGPSNIDRVRHSAAGSTIYVSDMVLYDDETADELAAIDADSWTTWMPQSLEGTSDDGDWATDAAGTLSDALRATDESIYTNSTSSDITLGVSDANDVQFAWEPPVVYGVMGVAMAFGDLGVNAELEVFDASGSAGSTTMAVATTYTFVWHPAPQDSSAADWDASSIDEVYLTYSLT